jgi:DNA modification methylase
VKTVNIFCKHDELVDPNSLVEHPKNRNKHPKDQVKRLAKLLEHYGFRHPIIVDAADRKTIIVGRGRQMAALAAKISEVPVVYQSFESEDQKYGFIQADNAISDWSELDLASINADLADLDPSFDIDLLGLKDFVIEPADKYAGEPDAPAGEPTEPISKLGDIYELGNHRLICGDATQQHVVDQLFNGQQARLMITDPPYGVKLDQSWRDKALGDKALGAGNKNVVANDDRADWYDVWAIAPTNIAYIWHASSFTDVVMESLRKAGFDVRQQIIWNKSVMVMGRSHYHFKHEPCWYAVKKGCDANWLGDRKQTTIWDAASPNHIMSGSKEDKTEHPTQKPIALYTKAIENHSTFEEIIYEPFGGSGTGLIACETTGRRCFAIELDPRYVDIIVERWCKFTNKDAYLVNRDKKLSWSELKNVK